MSYAQPPAYGKDLMRRRKAGERIGLLVVALHDWHAGEALAARSNVARVVVSEDNLPHELNWSGAVALDCLILGGDEPLLYAAATMLYAAGAASIWTEYSDGVWRLERWPSVKQGFFAADGPFSPAEFSRALQNHRDFSLVRRLGAYGAAMFDALRQATFSKLLAGFDDADLLELAE